MASSNAGRVVAISGAARGIGRATARALARDGARVAIGDLDSAGARELARTLGPAAIGLALDVSDLDSFRAFLDEAQETLGPIDALVNNAGIMVVGPFLEEDPAAAGRLIEVNLAGTMHGMRLALPRMVARGRGHVINVISAAAYVAPPGEASYAATKHAVRALTDAVREELRGSGVSLTGVFPGLVETDLAAGTRPSRGGRWIKPEEVGEAIARVVREPRPEVFVPRSLGGLLRLNAALPARAKGVLGRLFAVDKVATGVDPSSRAAYTARTFGRRGPLGGLEPGAAESPAARDSGEALREDAGHA